MQAKISELPVCDQRQDRVFLEPPHKGNPLKPDQIFVLEDDRNIYGTREAPQVWANNSLGVRLRRAGWLSSTYDLGLWFYFCPETSELIGAISLHVDDSFLTGTQAALDSLKALDVQWGEIDADKSKYCGVFYERDNQENKITATMEFYLQNVETFPIQGRLDDEILEGKDLSRARSLVGQLLWLSKARPDIAILANKAAQAVTSVRGVKIANKAVNYLNRDELEPMVFTYTKLEGPEDTIRVYGITDADFSPTDKGRSNYGNFFFLGAETSLNSPVDLHMVEFIAKTQNRFSKNPKIAELQALSALHSEGLVLVQLLEELKFKVSFYAFTDNESCFKNVYSYNPKLAETRYMPHLFALRDTFSPRISDREHAPPTSLAARSYEYCRCADQIY